MRLTDEQLRKLGRLIHFAFTDIRMLGLQRKAKHAADLADAFHNLPKDMWGKDFALEQFKDLYLLPYQHKYAKRRVRNYTKMVDEILEMGQDPSTN